jgi:hypothetical protein
MRHDGQRDGVAVVADSIVCDSCGARADEARV